MRNRIKIGNTTSDAPAELERLRAATDRHVAYDGATDHGHQFSIHKMTAVDSIDIDNLQQAVLPKRLAFAHNSLGDLILHTEEPKSNMPWSMLGILVSIAAAAATQDVLKEFADRLAGLWTH